MTASQPVWVTSAHSSSSEKQMFTPLPAGIYCALPVTYCANIH